jgi:hypothetical protein
MAGNTDVFNAMLAMINISTPWSEMEVGTPFEAWWTQQFGCELPSIHVGSLSQQLEWVTGHSCRAGINGRLKPFSGLSDSAQHLFGGKQASGAGTVKLVMRPVWCMSQANGEVMVSDKDRFWGIFPCSGSRLNLEPVSRDCIERSPPHTLLETCPDAIVAIDALQHAIANVHQ